MNKYAGGFLATVVAVAIVGSFFYFSQGSFAVPDQGYIHSTAYASTIDYDFGYQCSGGGTVERSLAVTGIPKDIYDLGVNSADSYVIVKGGGKTANISLSAKTLGLNPYAVL